MSEVFPRHGIELRNEAGTMLVGQLGPQHAQMYYDRIWENPAHVSRFGETMARDNLTVDKVREKLDNPAFPRQWRLGIWVQEEPIVGPTFVGSTRLTDSDEGWAAMGSADGSPAINMLRVPLDWSCSSRLKERPLVW